MENNYFIVFDYFFFIYIYTYLNVLQYNNTLFLFNWFSRLKNVFLQGAVVLSFYIDVILALSINVW